MKSVICILCLFFLPGISLFSSTSHHCTYFQQHLAYEIDCSLDIALNRIDGEQVLVYTNQSPDTLSELFFHLYLNKYRKSAFDYGDLRMNESGSIEIFEILENDSLRSIYFIDHTLMQISLHQPLLPGTSVKLYFKFAAKLPPASERYGYYGNHYDVGNWYPAPVVYDRSGWHLNQHLDNEFYQEWADFKVNIRVPKGFILGATGDLLNPEEALQDTAASVRISYWENPGDTTMTLWKYQAMKVHDFAWTADPDYVLYQETWNGITLNVLAMEHNKEEWRQVTEFGIEALEYFNNTFGTYPYNQVTVADTYIRAGGIEYPQITFINTYTSPLYSLNHFRSVIIHEMAHNWYYGLLANNQTEDEWLDEGFTTMAEILCMEQLFGAEDNYSYNINNWFGRHFHIPVSIRRTSALNYLEMAKTGEERDPINTYPDRFRGPVFISQYDKMASVLFMLQNVVGDSLFFRGLQVYYERWRFKHPYPEDFIAVMEGVCARDLDWFFDQWLNTTRTLDYGVESVDGKWLSGAEGRTFASRILLKNHGDISMPLDVDIHLKNGTVVPLHIPVDFSSKPANDRRIMRYWHFSQTYYKIEMEFPDEIDYVMLDPELMLLDINRLNNRSGLIPPMHFCLMKPVLYHPPIDAYVWEAWPVAMYNDIDKLKFGFNLKGSYLNIDHHMDVSIWLKSANTNPDVNVVYKHPLTFMSKDMQLNARAFLLDGRQGANIGLKKNLLHDDSGHKKTIMAINFNGYKTVDHRYPLYRWDSGLINTMDLTWKYTEGNRRRGDFSIEVQLINSIIQSRYDFSILFLNTDRIFRHKRSDVELRARFSAGYAKGDVPVQHQFHLSGCDGWDEFENTLFRSRGTLPYPWVRQGHIYLDRHAHVKGSALYPEVIRPYGENLVAGGLEFSFPNPAQYSPVYFIRDLNPALFAEMGAVWNETAPSLNEFVKSMGVSLSYDRFGIPGSLLNLERVRMDFPIWLSPVPEDTESMSFRWLITLEFEH